MNTIRLHPKVPKYIKIAEEFREQIESGALRPGHRMASFVEMRLRFGVSQAVLERAYALLEQDQLIVRQSGSGTFVAERNPKKLHNVLGCVFPATFHTRLPYYTHLLEGIRDVARRERQELMIMHEVTTINYDHVDGILFYGEWVEALRDQLPAAMVKVVLMLPCEDSPNVLADDFEGGKQATEFLLALGHRRIAYLIDVTPGLFLTPRRLAGYQAALRGAGIEPDPRWVGHLHNYGPMLNRGRLSMRGWLRDGWSELGCTGLLAQNDLAAIGAISAFKEAGIGVPHEVSVIGFDGTEECEIATPSLTSVRVPLHEIGATGAELLLKMVRGGSAPERPIVLATRVDARDSTTAINERR